MICATPSTARSWSASWDGTPQVQFDNGLADTIAWYRDNQQWLDDVRSGQYRDYFQKHYVQREKTFAV